MLRSPVSGSAVIESSTSSIRAAADLVLPEQLEERGPLRVLQVPLVRGGRDPLPDHLVDLRHDVQPPERLPQLEEVPGVGREVLRGLDLLERGPLRLVLLQRLGEDGLPRCQLQVAGPVRHPQRDLPREVVPSRPAERGGACDLRRGVGVPLGPGRLRRVRRPGHHVDRVLLPAAGRADVDLAADRAAVDHQVRRGRRSRPWATWTLPA